VYSSRSPATTARRGHEMSMAMSNGKRALASALLAVLPADVAVEPVVELERIELVSAILWFVLGALVSRDFGPFLERAVDSFF
jgi:hypothetical protein